MFWCHITATYGYEQYGKNYRLTLNIGFSLQWKKHIFWLDKREKKSIPKSAGKAKLAPKLDKDEWSYIYITQHTYMHKVYKSRYRSVGAKIHLVYDQIR